jgi:hypothetical protein
MLIFSLTFAIVVDFFMHSLVVSPFTHLRDQQKFYLNSAVVVVEKRKERKKILYTGNITTITK